METAIVIAITFGVVSVVIVLGMMVRACKFGHRMRLEDSRIVTLTTTHRNWSLVVTDTSSEMGVIRLMKCSRCGGLEGKIVGQDGQTQDYPFELARKACDENKDK